MPFDSLPITSPTIEVLRTGRVLIETRGLARGCIQDAEGRLCAVGAILSQSESSTRQPERNKAFDYLARAIPADVNAISAWNDVPWRTKADVIAAYERAIDLAVADHLA